MLKPSRLLTEAGSLELKSDIEDRTTTALQSQVTGGKPNEASDEQSSFLDELRTGPLLSGADGPLAVSSADRALIAVFGSGLAVVAAGSRWSPEVKAVLDRAIRSDLQIVRIVESESKIILAVYEKHAGDGSNGGPKGEIERQRELRHIISQAAVESASDIHIQVYPGYCDIRIRVHGRLRDLSNRSAEEGTAIINAAFAVATDHGSESGVSGFMKGTLTRASGLLPTDVDLIRLQYSPTSGHRPSLVMRLKYAIKKGETDIAGLGYLRQQVRDIGIMRRRTSGLYLLAGKVSSGKTTTLQRILNAMIREKAFEISAFAIEEPVELEISGAVHVAVVPRSGQTRRQAFAEAVKSTLRSDPNVIVLGELRDEELAGNALELAMTGHALWSTVHSGSALGILDRLNDLGVAPWKLAEPSVIKGLIYQRLVGTLCPHCKLSYRTALARQAISGAMVEEVAGLSGRSPERLFLRGPGCEKCSSGLGGRTVVAETVLPDPILLNHYVSEDRTAMREYWLRPVEQGGVGGIPVMHHAMIKVGRGTCDINEVEEEIDLVSSYRRDYPFHARRLAADLKRFQS